MLFGLAKLLTGGLQVTKWAELILKKKLEVLKEVATTDLQRDMELKRPQEY